MFCRDGGRIRTAMRACTPVQDQATRVYDEYLRQAGETTGAELAYHAISLVGPRNRIDKLAHRLGLLV